MIPYTTSHPISRKVMAAVAKGLGAKLEHAVELAWRPEPAVVYGILRGCGDIIRMSHQTGIDFWHIDLGYFGRGHYDGFYRLSKNGMQADTAVLDPAPRTRGHKLPTIEPWRPGSGPIVICPPTQSFCMHNPLEVLEERTWIFAVTTAISSLTDRPVEVCTKEGGKALSHDDPWCVVVHSSNVGVDFLLRGTPVIALGAGVIRKFGPTITEITDKRALRACDRDWMLQIMAANQFTLDEFAKGVPWK